MQEKILSQTLLWISFLAPFTAWFIQLNASFLLTAHSCQKDAGNLHAISIGALIVCLIGLGCGLISWHSTERTRKFLSACFFIMGAIILLIILGGEISNFMLESCP